MKSRRSLVVLAGVGGVALLAAAAWETAVRLTPLPAGLDAPPFTSVVEDRRGRPLAVRSTPALREAYPVPLRDMSPWLPVATVGIEDHRFASHRGVDAIALARAVLHPGSRTGASTITQQVIKLASPPAPRSVRTKVREILAAAHLERRWSKREILEAYLNRLDYGNRRIGPEAAARAYFGKSARDLTLPEAVFLAGLPQSPTRLNPWTNSDAALARYDRNVRRLSTLGLLPDGVTAQTLRDLPPRVTRHDPPNLAVDGLSDQPTRGRRLATTLDLTLQETVSRLAAEHLRGVAGTRLTDVAVVVLDNRTSEIRAMVSAGDPRHAGLTAALVPRSCGSTLKPFLYLAGIESRTITAASLLPDTPDAITDRYADYDPQNFTDRYRGPVRAREALGNSLNVPAVVLLGRLGARPVHHRLRAWGMDFPDSFAESGAGFILGNARVTTRDLAAAYAALARGGLAANPRLFVREALETHPVASADACAIVTEMLCDNSARRLSFGLQSPLALPWRTAVKTGTSSGFRDGWCVGFSGDHTVAVWAGNLDGSAMNGLLAVRSAAPLWAAVMRHLYASGDRPVPEPVASETLRPLDVAAETGFLPAPGEPTVREWFLAGTEPQEASATRYVDGILQLPPEYAAWCASPQNHLGATVTATDLRIVFPRDGAQFVFNDAFPASRQVLAAQASHPGCEWFLNGTRLDRPAIPLARGTWELTARANGQSATARFAVE